MPWLRLHTDILDDPKMHVITESQFSHFILMLCVASECNASGALPQYDVKSLSWRLRTRATDLRKTIDKLIEMGIMYNSDGQLGFCNWEKRQYSESYKRVKKHREKRYSNNNVTEKKRYSNDESNANVTADTDTDTDTDKNVKTNPSGKAPKLPRTTSEACGQPVDNYKGLVQKKVLKHLDERRIEVLKFIHSLKPKHKAEFYANAIEIFGTKPEPESGSLTEVMCLEKYYYEFYKNKTEVKL